VVGMIGSLFFASQATTLAMAELWAPGSCSASGLRRSAGRA
jgi:hypothetical protein